MAQDWMIDILTDIRQYAQKNAMLELAEHLDDAIIVAAHEIRAAAESRVVAGGHDVTDRDLHRPTAEHEFV
jgi:hypothetical protein